MAELTQAPSGGESSTVLTCAACSTQQEDQIS
jgi:hypothetical protein